MRKNLLSLLAVGLLVLFTACIYNDLFYGNVYHNSFAEYLVRQKQ